MTTITINRATVEQALEALEAMQSYAAAERKGLRICDEAIAALRAALAQQAEPVEPVAWMLTDAQNPRVRFLEWQKETRAYSGEWIKTPLYTAPPQRVPLTDEEILDAVGWGRAEMYMKLTPNFPVDEAKKETLKNARAIERAHGIGRQSDPQVEDRLARHGIPMPEAPVCLDCHGVGYDASGQLCACQENPSF